MLTELTNPSREISICGDAPLSVYALELDGVNSYLQSQSTQGFLGTTQESTFFLSIQDFATTGNNQVFLDTISASVPAEGFVIQYLNASALLRVQVQGSGAGITQITTPYAGEEIITVQFNPGFNNGNNVEIYLDGVIATKTIVSNTCAPYSAYSDIFTIGSLSPNRPSGVGQYAKQVIKRASAVDYAQSSSEILANAGTGIQTATSGTFLYQYDFNVPPSNQSLVVSNLAGTEFLNINGQTAPGDWVCIENCI